MPSWHAWSRGVRTAPPAGLGTRSRALGRPEVEPSFGRVVGRVVRRVRRVAGGRGAGARVCLAFVCPRDARRAARAAGLRRRARVAAYVISARCRAEHAVGIAARASGSREGRRGALRLRRWLGACTLLTPALCPLLRALRLASVPGVLKLSRSVPGARRAPHTRRAGPSLDLPPGERTVLTSEPPPAPPLPSFAQSRAAWQRRPLPPLGCPLQIMPPRWTPFSPCL